ncbi:MAG: PLP-dependent aminotransferase family protein [Actinomycetaceae bacterium]|nr:PLP-dependent aminotransferase family protein [Actinomycetaceae bacterium]
MSESAGNSRQGTRLDPWLDTYAARAHNLRSSEIRSLFSVVSRPEVVSLAGGMPNIKDLPLDDLAQSFAELIRTDGATALQYGNGQGYAPLLEMITEVVQYDGIRTPADNVVITTGSQQALDLVTQIFVDPGDVVLVEAPSYVGALGIFRAYQADVQHVLMDNDGLIPEALEEAIKDCVAAGKRIKMLYTIPNFHNPGGMTLSAERRPSIVDICRRHGVLIIEDNPYGLLGFHADPNPSLKSLNPDGVVYLGSFSKMLAPGFRIGWAVAPSPIKDKLVLASEAAILSPSMAGQMAINKYLREFDWYQQVKSFRGMYLERCEAMMKALQDYLPQCTWTVPDGGFYTWVTLPEGIDAKAMLPRAVTALVAYVSGTAFYYDGRGGDHIRLSFCYPPPETIREGVRRLAGVVKAEQELVELFGTNVRPDESSTRSISIPAPNQP